VNKNMHRRRSRGRRWNYGYLVAELVVIPQLVWEVELSTTSKCALEGGKFYADVFIAIACYFALLTVGTYLR